MNLTSLAPKSLCRIVKSSGIIYKADPDPDPELERKQFPDV